MTRTEELDQIWAWIRSHANRLRRKEYEPPNHLANGSAHFLSGTERQVFTLDASGNLPDVSALQSTSYRLEVYEKTGTLLFSQNTV